MAVLSKLHDKCEKCKYEDACNNKRMVACRLAEIPQNNMNSASELNNVGLSQPILKDHTPITINMGECGAINTSLEEIQDQLKREFYKNLNIGCNYGY